MVIRSSIYAGTSNLVELLLSLLTAGLSIRYLGIEDAGFFLFFESLMRINGGLFNLGFQGAVTLNAGESFAIGDQAGTQGWINTGMTLDLLLLTAPCLLIVAFISPIVEWSGYSGDRNVAFIFILLSVATVVIQKLNTVVTTGLAVHQCYGTLSIYNSVIGIILNASRLVVLLIAPSLITLGLCNALVCLLGGVALLIQFKSRSGWIPCPGISVRRVVKLWAFTKWEYVTNLFLMLTGDLDRILITQYFGLSVLPIYSMSKRVLTLGHRFITGFTDYLFPLLSAQSGDARVKLVRNLEYPLPWFLFGLGTLIYGSAVLLGPISLNILVGQDFGSHASPSILGFSIVGMSSLFGVLPYHVARSNGWTHLNTYSSIMSSSVIFPLIWLLASQGHFVGAVLCQALTFPVYIIHYHFVMGRKAWGDSLSRQLRPALGFTTAWALVVLYYLSSGSFNQGWLHAITFEALLLIGIASVAVHQVWFGKNKAIKDLRLSRLNPILATVKSYLTNTAQ